MNPTQPTNPPPTNRRAICALGLLLFALAIALLSVLFTTSTSPVAPRASAPVVLPPPPPLLAAESSEDVFVPAPRHPTPLPSPSPDPSPQCEVDSMDEVGLSDGTTEWQTVLAGDALTEKILMVERVDNTGTLLSRGFFSAERVAVFPRDGRLQEVIAELLQSGYELADLSTPPLVFVKVPSFPVAIMGTVDNLNSLLKDKATSVLATARQPRPSAGGSALQPYLSEDELPFAFWSPP